MELYSSPDLDPGEFQVAMNPGISTGKPFGVISLGPRADLHVNSDEDADRLIRALVRTKELRARIGVPHEWQPRNGLCGFCGMAKSNHAAPAPVPESTVTAEGTCAADASNGEGLILCTLAPHGPEQRHERHDQYGGITYWPAGEPVLEGAVTGKPADAPYAPVLNGAGHGTAG